jgi:hypothetical protein
MSNLAFARSLGVSPVAHEDLPRPSILKSLDYGNIARMLAIAGVGFLAYQSLKALMYGGKAETAFKKARKVVGRLQRP